MSDGRTLSIWQIGDAPVFKLLAGTYPIKCNGCHIMTDDAARDLLRDLRAAQTEGSCDVDAA
jgi:hypothetical protein